MVKALDYYKGKWLDVSVVRYESIIEPKKKKVTVLVERVDASIVHFILVVIRKCAGLFFILGHPFQHSMLYVASIEKGKIDSSRDT